MGGKTFAVRLVSLALVLIVCLIALKFAFVRALSGAPASSPALPMTTGNGPPERPRPSRPTRPPAFADDAYDMVYPDLIEPSLEDGE